MITTSELAFADGEHGVGEELCLGCSCGRCYRARRDHIEKEIADLYENERGLATVSELRLSIIQQALQGYLAGAVTYEAMKTRLIEQLWKMAQDHYKAECKRASRAY